MLTLCGFSVSNYYNKVKLALLEKAIPFEEELLPAAKPYLKSISERPQAQKVSADRKAASEALMARMKK